MLLDRGRGLTPFMMWDVLEYLRNTKDFKVVYVGLFMFVASLLISFLIKNFQYGYEIHSSAWYYSDCFFREWIFIAAIFGYLELIAAAFLGRFSKEFNMAVYISFSCIVSLWVIVSSSTSCY